MSWWTNTPRAVFTKASAAAPATSGGVVRSPCDQSRTVHAAGPTIRVSFHHRPSTRPNRIIVGITAASLHSGLQRLRPRGRAHPLLPDAPSAAGGYAEGKGQPFPRPLPLRHHRGHAGLPDG